MKFSETKPTIRRNPPLHGEHTDEVLGEIGFSESEIEGLRDEGVV